MVYLRICTTSSIFSGSSVLHSPPGSCVAVDVVFDDVPDGVVFDVDESVDVSESESKQYHIL